MTDLLMTLAEISLTMSAVILLLLALGPLLARRYAARWRYWAWLLIAVRLLLPVRVPAMWLSRRPMRAPILFVWHFPRFRFLLFRPIPAALLVPLPV